MNTRPTPETDTNSDDAHNVCLYYDCQGINDNLPAPIVVCADFARKLERERDEAREETIRTREFMDYGFAKAQEELTDMTAQRDRLAEALEMITTFDCSDLQCDNGHGCRYVAIEALQSLTQKP